MVPVAWVRMPSLPLTANGKLARERLPAPTQRALRARNQRRRPPRRRRTSGRSSRPSRRCSSIRPVEAEDDFFALGGHSLLALALCAEVAAAHRACASRPPRSSPPRRRARSPPRWARAPVRQGRWDTLVELRGEGSRPPLFVVTAGDGNLLAFAALTRRLERRAAGLRAPATAGSTASRPFDRSIAALAERYLGEVRRRPAARALPDRRPLQRRDRRGRDRVAAARAGRGDRAAGGARLRAAAGRARRDRARRAPRPHRRHGHRRGVARRRRGARGGPAAARVAPRGGRARRDALSRRRLAPPRRPPRRFP